MGFLMTTVIFFVAGLVASIVVPLCCNRGSSTNLYAVLPSDLLLCLVLLRAFTIRVICVLMCIFVIYLAWCESDDWMDFEIQV